MTRVFITVIKTCVVQNSTLAQISNCFAVQKALFHAISYRIEHSFMIIHEFFGLKADEAFRAVAISPIWTKDLKSSKQASGYASDLFVADSDPVSFASPHSTHLCSRPATSSTAFKAKFNLAKLAISLASNDSNPRLVAIVAPGIGRTGLWLNGF